MVHQNDSSFCAQLPRVASEHTGYRRSDVERFFNGGSRALFRPAKGGFEPSAVDRAVSERLDARAATRARERIKVVGEDEFVREVEDLCYVLMERGLRAPEEKFRTPKRRSSAGYHKGDVDHFCERLVKAFEGAAEEESTHMPLGSQDVRDVLFRSDRNGYDEAQVDAYLEDAAEALAVVKWMRQRRNPSRMTRNVLQRPRRAAK